MRLHVARKKLRTIVAQACNDRYYMNVLRNDPVDVLVNEGLPFDVIEDFLRETGLQADVSGYAMSGQMCANSCALSHTNAYPPGECYFPALSSL
ncbi:hypothetical protein [Tengunoibacter tsumagoiensis]|uniref:Uncharacterized protein n=1 Tax=Tengunoibacter tsumagoiensis TaxID=2014871 RepID=A0A402A676_9CHLR|nr:hypothetical protein [Tengunoibacter tsumagoiensis]GCE14643.1 hypothetical protein KTT_45020 [Tengunoibacter tsumagoiensis]